MRILHVINRYRLGGGAQEMLRKLTTFSLEPMRHHVFSLAPPAESDIQLAQKDHTLVNVRVGPKVAADIARYRRLVRAFDPDLILAWMYHSCAFAQIFTPRGYPVVWNIRHSIQDIRQEKVATRGVIRFCSALSGRAAGAVYCSRATISEHAALGFRPRREFFIPNGFDTAEFSPAGEDEKKALRARYGIPVGATVVGQAARFHPMKNQLGLIEAFAQVANSDPRLHLVMAGRQVDPENTIIARKISETGAEGRVTLLGLQSAMADVLNCMDIYVSSSLWGEGFPNVLGEAMACGVPCIATNIGDSEAVIGDTGVVLKNGGVQELRDAIASFAGRSQEDREAMSKRAGLRIEREFSLRSVVEKYRAAFSELARPGASALMGGRLPESGRLL